jgi:hypothetical protein
MAAHRADPGNVRICGHGRILTLRVACILTTTSAGPSGSEVDLHRGLGHIGLQSFESTLDPYSGFPGDHPPVSFQRQAATRGGRRVDLNHGMELIQQCAISRTVLLEGGLLTTSFPSSLDKVPYVRAELLRALSGYMDPPCVASASLLLDSGQIADDISVYGLPPLINTSNGKVRVATASVYSASL